MASTWVDSDTAVVTYDLVIGGPLGDLGAPHINGTIVINIMPDGSFIYVFVRDGYPWAEGYIYYPDGTVDTLFQDSAVTGDPNDLLAIEPAPGALASALQILNQAMGILPNLSTGSGTSGGASGGGIPKYLFY